MREKARRASILKRVGLKISRDLHERDKSVDALALEIGMARSTLREIIAGRSNPRLLSIEAIAHGLGYRGLSDFFSDL